MKKKNKCFLFWITGLSGSGKTSISKKITPFIEKRYGPTINFSGDDIRKTFGFDKFDKVSRIKYAMFYSKLCKILVDEGYTVIFSTVSLFSKVREWNKINIKGYVEIYIKTDINKLIKKRNKFFYKKKKFVNIVGKNIKAEFPKKATITIKNDFSRSLNNMRDELIQKIKKKYD